MARDRKPIPTGTRFGGVWVVKETWSCAESVAHGYGGKNRHYVCYNEQCDVTAVVESSVIKRWIALADEGVPACQKCNGKCFFAKEHRHDVHKTPTRNTDDEKYLPYAIGKVFGDYTVISPVHHSAQFIDHNARVVVRCNNCGTEALLRLDTVREGKCLCRNPK